MAGGAKSWKHAHLTKDYMWPVEETQPDKRPSMWNIIAQ